VTRAALFMNENGKNPPPVAHDVRGRDLDAPEMFISLGGQRYRLRFNNKATRVAEDVYEDVFGKDLGYYLILKEAANFKHRALQALYYGALIGGGNEMTWEEFDRLFSVSAIDGMSDVIQKAIARSLPEADPKNGETTPGTGSASPGRG